MLYLPDGGVAYFNKLTGIMQYGGRPDDFRPYLKVHTPYYYCFLIKGVPPITSQDEVFEESIVDFFETADTNKDGVVDYNDFYSVSHCM